jgi:hypothetical protein
MMITLVLEKIIEGNAGVWGEEVMVGVEERW